LNVSELYFQTQVWPQIQRSCWCCCYCWTSSRQVGFPILRKG
jgi:hypothetical protein